MASVEKMTHVTAESEMEEGEIVDELDDLSDVSSEEEFLLRQRLEVLEDYNNALERTKRKRTSGTIKPLRDYTYNRSKLSEVNLKSFHSVNDSKYVKQYSKPKRKKDPVYKNVDVAYLSKKKRDHRKKNSLTRSKPKLQIIRESSDESEDEYRNKRRKLEDAVVGYRGKTDTSSLSARLKKMLHKSEEPVGMDILNMYRNNNSCRTNSLKIQLTHRHSVDEVDCGGLKHIPPKEKVKEKTLLEPIDILSSDNDDDVKVITNDNKQSTPTEDAIVEPNQTKPETLHEAESDSDEDLAQLRQQVLSTKALKAKPQEVEPETKVPSEDEDSDTAELRLICLKSTLLKRAIEMKQKQKLQKRRSQSTLEDDIFNNEIFFPSKIDSGNNTDIEAMDMDIGSDADEKNKDGISENVRLKKTEADTRQYENSHNSAITKTNKEEELEEDEDLLRAKLLTSLSKNLPNLVSPEKLNTIDEVKVNKTTVQNTKSAPIPKEKRFIIKLDGSDSEGEHEATKNLTKMHMKLAEQTDFQHQLDLLLKSTRMQVENAKLPDVVQKQATPKPEKFVAKAVNHLPKSEQIEYKNLVRRMAELVKMKQLRQASINSAVQPLKETLKPINTTVDTSLEERISLSRKKIADESSKMLKLKEEATKLSQRFKIVSTELHNISTAITLNKKQQRAVHNCLSKIRNQHQTLIKSSSTSLHSKVNGRFNSFTSNATATKLQKENTPKDEYKNVVAQKTVKISIANDFNKNEANTNPRLCVEVDIANNKKVVKIPSPVMDKSLVEITKTLEKQITDISNTLANESYDIINTVGGIKQEINNECENLRHIVHTNDYKSPLDALAETWKWDPNAILCPFDVAGQCKDSDCEYLHILSQQ